MESCNFNLQFLAGGVGAGVTVPCVCMCVGGSGGDVVELSNGVVGLIESTRD